MYEHFSNIQRDGASLKDSDVFTLNSVCVGQTSTMGRPRMPTHPDKQFTTPEFIRRSFVRQFVVTITAQASVNVSGNVTEAFLLTRLLGNITILTENNLYA